MYEYSSWNCVNNETVRRISANATASSGNRMNGIRSSFMAFSEIDARYVNLNRNECLVVRVL